MENIDVYIHSWGSTQKLNQTANIGITDAHTIKIEPWDKSILGAIEKAIYDSGLGFTPLNQGEYIMIKVPPLTEERRRDLTKIVAKDGEEAKVAIRNHRHDARKTLDTKLKNEEISENEKNSTEKKVDELTKEYNDKIDHMVRAKSEEIMKI
ncbi:MAG: ribosome recycling factor [Candidatus Peribacteria bacterium]|nr:MAG: ribosome recycling factor [Candidatus Peribacteria bacterium]